MRALITGISGFAGSHLADYCLARTGVDVIGMVRSRARLGQVAPVASRIQLVEADVRDAPLVERAVEQAQPDVIFHLAGQPYVPRAFEDPAGTFQDNAIGQINLIRAILRHRPQARLLVVGSSTEYGMVRPDENPVHEDVPLRPTDPYAVSKVAQDLLGFQYFISHGLQAVRVRPFNHIGPRQDDVFVTSRFARQIAEIEAGVAEPALGVGNLSSVRDFTDVRDMVRAYYLAATMGESGTVYNLGSGRGRRIEEILGLLAAFSKVHFVIREESAQYRPVDVPVLVCNGARFAQRTNWEPQVPLERTLLDLLDYWRERVAANKRAAEAAAPATASLPVS